MSGKKITSTYYLQNFADYCSKRLSLHSSGILSTFRLLAEGDSVPFIARYRRQETGELDADKIYLLKGYYENFDQMSKTRDNRIAKLESQGLLDDSLRAMFNRCVTMEELDEVRRFQKSNIVNSFLSILR